LISFDPERGQKLQENPHTELALFEKAAVAVLHSYMQFQEDNSAKLEIQVIIKCVNNKITSVNTISELNSDLVSKLIIIRGIITAAAKPKNKTTEIWLKCQNCHNTERLVCQYGLGAVNIPRNCKAQIRKNISVNKKCQIDPYIILIDKCQYIDQQTLKLQELTEDTMDGDLPRSIVLITDRHLVNKVVPGTKVIVYGIYCISLQTSKSRNSVKNISGVHQPYIHVVGIEEINYSFDKQTTHSDHEIHSFQEFAKSPLSQEKLFNMIAPKIFGHENVKKAIACLLFGGSRRKLPDGGTLRGNINLLLLGDPSTAKSQFLKFVEKTAPVCVYTSGKGSSAAGLTATVIRDATTLEFYLEGGAMVLADGGIVCIDEFDKMRTEDRIALHEAMEQQTISIAKAGITTVLNARVGVLAAANPPSGRYDDLRSAEENIDMQNTILSRFDLIFVIRDNRLEDKDIKIAQHVCSVHRNINLNQNFKEQNVSTHDNFLKRYISYARSNCEPSITKKAESLLIEQYVKYRSLRRRSVQKEPMNYENNQHSQQTLELPITVRQLEALIRISEALSRMILSTEVTEFQVEQAIQLFRFSTAQTASVGITGIAYVSIHEKKEHFYVLEVIRRYIAINQLKSESRLVTEVMRVTGVDMLVVHKALGIMRRAKDLLYFPEKRMVKRLN